MNPESSADSPAWLHQPGDQSSGVEGARGQHESPEPRWVGIGFRIGERRLVTATGDVDEVLRLPRVTRVPGAKGWLRGLANLRGALMPVVDLHAFLCGEFAEPIRASRVLCVKMDEGTVVGLQVDQVLGLKHFLSTRREDPTGEYPGWLRPYLSGTFREEGELWCVFELGRLLATPEFQRAAM